MNELTSSTNPTWSKGVLEAHASYLQIPAAESATHTHTHIHKHTHKQAKATKRDNETYSACVKTNKHKKHTAAAVRRRRRRGGGRPNKGRPKRKKTKGAKREGADAGPRLEEML
jgi:hypothetical protein